MWSNLQHDECIEILEDRILAAETVTPDLLSEVITTVCERANANGIIAPDDLKRLIGSGAWTDAALTLVDLELPQWHLRRLVKDDGEWLCTLSRRQGLPLEFNELVETRHELLPLAILSALLQAKRASSGFAAGATAASQNASWQSRRRPQQPIRRETFVTLSVVVLAALVLFCAGMLAPAVWTALVESSQIQPSGSSCVVLDPATGRSACVEDRSERTSSHPAKGANAPSILRLSGRHTD